MPKKGIDKEAEKLLFRTLLAMKKEDEIIDLFKSLLSSSEIKDLSRRIFAAKLLRENHTFLDINDLMGMSSSTINKIYFKTKGSPTIQKLFSTD